MVRLTPAQEGQGKSPEPLFAPAVDKVVKCTWVLMAAMWLLLALRAGHPEASGALLVLPLIVMGFPASYAATWLIAGTTYALDQVGLSLPGNIGMIAVWLTLASAGYLQWFYVVPALFRWRRHVV